MTINEFEELVVYMNELWPRHRLNKPQKVQWFARLQSYDKATVRDSLDKAYAEGKWNDPKLPDVLHAARSFRPPGFTGDKDFPQQFIDQCKREDAETNAAIAHLSHEDRESCKREILLKEPELRAIFENVSVDNPMWKRFIETRFIIGEVPTFLPGGSQFDVPVLDWWASKRTRGPMAAVLTPKTMEPEEYQGEEDEPA